MTFIKITPAGVGISLEEFSRHSVLARDIEKMLVEGHMSACY